MIGSSGLRLALLAVVTSGALAVGVRGQDQHGRAEFMREKLNHSKRILDGLAREDYSQITKGAMALKAMRESPEWPSMSHPEAGRYAVYTLEFQALTDELVARSAEKNIDGATLTYLRLTMNCVNCHKELRSRRR